MSENQYRVKVIERYYRRGIFRLYYFRKLEQAEHFSSKQNGRCRVEAITPDNRWIFIKEIGPSLIEEEFNRVRFRREEITYDRNQ